MTDQDHNQDQPNELDTLLKSITNKEGQPKYQSAEDALKGAAHAQEHIQTLENENATLKTDKEKMEELIKQFQPKQEEKPEATTPVTSTADKPELNVDELYTQFRQRLTQEQQAEAQNNNKRSAVEAAAKAYGDKTEEVINAKANELGVSKDFLLGIAANSPTAFGNLLGLNSKPAPQRNYTSTSVNTETLNYTNQEDEKLPNPLRTGNTRDGINLMRQIEERLSKSRKES